MSYTRTPVAQSAVNPAILTYRDCIEHLIDYADGLPQEAEQRRARRCIQQAYRDLSAFHSWRYFLTHGRLQLDAPYSTGTVAVTAATRVCTLSSGTWPSWAAQGTLKIGDVLYRVATRDSNTQLTLHPTHTPAANVTAGTSYTLFRSCYPLPADLVRMGEMHDESGWGGSYVLPEEWLELERRITTSSADGFLWTILGSDKGYGQLEFRCYGYPSAATTLDYLYHRRPRAMVLDGFANFSSNTSGHSIAAIFAGATTCTATGFTPTAEMYGSILRFARVGSTAPPEGSGGNNPFLMQKVITAVSGATITFDSAAEYATATTHFSISDPVDLPEYCHSALLRAMELNWSLRSDPKLAGVASAAYRDALLDALARDHVAPLPESLMGGVGWTMHDWLDAGEPA